MLKSRERLRCLDFPPRQRQLFLKNVISFPDLAGGRAEGEIWVKSDLYHVIACQECDRRVNSACPRQFLENANQMNNQ